MGLTDEEKDEIGGSVGLTDEEKEVLELSAQLWNKFIRLHSPHPSDHIEMQLKIHGIQEMVALRVARRVDPEIWHQPKER